MNETVDDRLKQIRMQHGQTQGQIGEILNRTAMFVFCVQGGKGEGRPFVSVKKATCSLPGSLPIILSA